MKYIKITYTKDLFPSATKNGLTYRFVSGQEVHSLVGSREAGDNWPGLYRVDTPIDNEVADIIFKTITRAIIVDVDHIEGTLRRLRGSTKQYAIERLNVIETGIKKVKVNKYLTKL